MDLDRLVLAHWKRPYLAEPAVVPAAGRLWLETCQRQLLVTSASRWRPPRYPLTAPEPDLLHGQDAYRFLLEVGAGLHSHVPGETQVLGQLRQAVVSCRRSVLAQTGLMAWLERALSDIRQIRSRHLQGVGRDGWGSLVRRVMRPAGQDRILVLGAGQLSESLLPWLSEAAVGIWNRSEKRPLSDSHAVRFFSSSQAAAAMDWARSLIVATPPDPGNDRRWTRLARAGTPGQILNMGRYAADPGPWSTLPDCLYLDDLVRLRRRRNDLRDAKLALARESCAAVAGQRSKRPGRGPVLARAS